MQTNFLDVGDSWMPPEDGSPANAFTCDVEDYFQVSAFEDVIPRKAWGKCEVRLTRNINIILEMCADAGVKGTFFTLGWVAKHYPEIVRRISAEGHEIASHGMNHVRVSDQTSEAFLEDLSDSKKLLEDVSGIEVSGFRAASWSLDARTPWAHELMAEAGYRYSSSIYPIAHDHYGIPDAPRLPFFIRGLDLLEIPATTVRYFGRNWPAAGGGYFRLFPYAMSIELIRAACRSTLSPAVFYFHPWELDPSQPRVPGTPFKTRFRHYINLGRFQPRLLRLLNELKWDRMDKIFF